MALHPRVVDKAKSEAESKVEFWNSVIKALASHTGAEVSKRIGSLFSR